MDVEEQVKALSLKCYEYQSENLKLVNETRDWINNYNRLTVAYNDMQKERDEAKRELESLKKKRVVDKVPKKETPKEETINE